MDNWIFRDAGEAYIASEYRDGLLTTARRDHFRYLPEASERGDQESAKLTAVIDSVRVSMCGIRPLQSTPVCVVAR